MSEPRALHELMTAVDAGHVVHVDVESASSDKLVAPRRASYSRRRRQSAPVVAETPPESSDASFEFSAVVSYSSASPASMVFSDGQLRAHQFPAVRSSGRSSWVASPVRSSSVGSAKAGASGSKKRVSFAMDGADRAAAAKAVGGQGKKSGGLMGCIGSACGLTRNEVVQPAKNVNRKGVAVSLVG